MKKVKKPLLIVLIVLVVFIGVIAISIIKSIPKPQSINLIEFSKVKDGTYTGSCDNKLVKATVEVKVSGGKVTEINILKHDNGMGKKAESITGDVLQKQSLEVDAVSGATLSSNTILKAVENALQQGISK